MPETPEGGGHHGGGGSGIKGFLTAQTGPLPNWAWIVVVVGGIAAAILVPKFFGKKGTTAQTAGDQSGNQGLGLAIDPTTGLPYAVEGLVPSGGVVGAPPGTQPPVSNPTPPPTPTPGPPTPSPYTPLFSTLPSGFPKWITGNTFTAPGGQVWTIVVGKEGRIWGVPGKVSVQTAENMPVALGQKQLLYQTPAHANAALPVPTNTVDQWNGQTQIRMV